MPAKIDVGRIMQLRDDLKAFHMLHNRFIELSTGSADDHRLQRDYEAAYRRLESLSNLLCGAELTLKG